MNTIEQRPFLIIGECEPHRRARLKAALDVIMAQPCRWHSGWGGGQVYSLVLAPNQQTDTFFQDWACARRLPIIRGAPPERSVFDFNLWGALLVGRSLSDLDIARQSIRSGVPTLAIDLDTLEMLEVSDVELKSWKSLILDDTQQLDIIVDEIDDNDSDEKSLFLPNSVTLPLDPREKAPLGTRNGDQCAFSQSQAGKVG